MTVLGRAGRRAAQAVLLAAGLVMVGVVVAPPTPVYAQTGGADDCLCVDAAGQPIDGCIWVRPPERVDLWADLPFARRAVIGVSIDYAQGAQLEAQGAEMLEVLEGGPADRAGMRSGDVVTHVKGRSVFDPLEPARERALNETESLPVQRFVQLIGELIPGQSVEIRYLRRGEPRTATVTPEAAVAAPLDMWAEAVPRFEQVFGTGAQAPTVRANTITLQLRRPDLCATLGDDGARSIRLFGVTNCMAGVEFVELTPGLGEYFGTERGVLVADVAEASTLGLRPGDVLLKVDVRDVDSVDTARRILGSYLAGEELRLGVMRRGAPVEIPGRMP